MRFNGRMAGSIKRFAALFKGMSREFESFIPVEFISVELTFDSTKSSAAMDSHAQEFGFSLVSGELRPPKPKTKPIIFSKKNTVKLS